MFALRLNYLFNQFKIERQTIDELTKYYLNGDRFADAITIMKYKSKLFINPRLIFDQQQYEKLINKTTSSNDVHDECKSENSNNLQRQTVVGQEFAFNVSCSECDASKGNETFYENVLIKLTLPTCSPNHGNDDGELNYSSFKKHLMGKSE